MYAGEIVERAPADALFDAPQHPYTVGLLASIPRLDQRAERLAAIEGMLPDMTPPPVGCRFADRCPFVLDACRKAPPPVVDVGAGHLVALHARAAGTSGVVTALLEVEGLVKHFVAARSIFGRALSHVNAVDGVSFTVEAGKTLALVGESGCGKSTVGRLVLRLIEPDRGTIRFEGRDFRARRRRASRLSPPGADHLPGSVRLAQSAHDRGQILTEPLALHGLVPPATAARARRGDPAPGRARAAVRAALSARVLRRPAPAYRHCPRARGRAEADRLRRAGLGARRLDPLADPQPAARPPAAGSASPTFSSRTTSRWSSTSPTMSR